MIPAIGDTLDGRYTLIAQYRAQPGLSAWIARDHALDQDCQIFLLTDETRIQVVSQIASALVLSHNPRSTVVRRFHAVGDALIVVMDPDPGTPLSTLIGRGRHLSFAAMRMIVNELIDTIQSLHSSQVDFHTLVPEVIRLTPTSLLLSSVPLDPYIEPPLATRARQTSTGTEMLAILQISAILYEMLTGVTFDPHDMESMNLNLLDARHEAQLRENDIPSDFLTILERALGVHLGNTDETQQPFPIYTLMEMQALLDNPLRPGKLTAKDLQLPSTPGTASVSLVHLLPSSQQDVVDIPDSLISTDTVHNEAGVIQPWSRQELFAGTNVQEVDPSAAGLLGPRHPAADETGIPSSPSSSNVSGRSVRSSSQPTNRVVGSGNIIVPGNTGASADVSASEGRKTESAYISEAVNEVHAEKSAHTQTIVDHHVLSPADSRKFEEREKEERQKKNNPHRLAQGIVVCLAAIAVAVGAGLSLHELRNTVNISLPWSKQENDADIGKHWNIDPSKAPLPGNAKQEEQEEKQDAKDEKRESGSRTSAHRSSSKATRSRVTEHRRSKGVIIDDKNASPVPKPVQPVAHPVPLPFTQRFFSTTTGRGVAITLTGSHRVTSVTLTLRNATNGETGKLYADATLSDPRHGKPVASFTFATGNQPTRIPVSGSLTTQNLVIWLDQVPQNGLYYSGISVLGQE